MITNENTHSRKKADKSSWIKCLIVTVLFVAWVIWLGNYFVLLGIPFIFDIYITKLIPWTFWKKSKNKAFKKVMEWLDAIVFALIAVYFINTFFFQNYKIPSSSLEKTLLVGDYLFVSKMSYGPRVPNTPLSFPLAQHTMPFFGTKSYIEWPQWAYHRLKGFGQVKRNDIVVFNYPSGDTVALKVQMADYYQLCAEYGHDVVNRNKDEFGDIVYRPVDRRENYVKRAIGMPGDNLQIINDTVYIDGKPGIVPKEMQLNYLVETNGVRLGENNFRELNISNEDQDRCLLTEQRDASYALKQFGFEPNANGDMNPVYNLPLTQESLHKIKQFPFVTKILKDPGLYRNLTYPLNNTKTWTSSNYGPIWIPKKGATLKLTPDNMPIYERVIKNYENNDLQIKDGDFYINGKKSDSYTFKMNYYFMMGDNRDNSADSRAWGFVPEDHVVGKPLFIWLSINKDRSLFDGKIRFNRIFKSVTNE